MMVYYIIALGLFVGVGCREVLRRLLDGAVWIWPDRIKIATDSAITQARQRLGCEPIETLYQEHVGPIAKKTTRGAWFRSWRVVSMDGFVMDVAESDANEKAFGRPGSTRGHSAYPQVRVVGLLENGTHVFFGAEMDRYGVGETTLARRILGKLRRNMLCLADRNFFCFPLWKQALATKAKLVWRAKQQLVLPKTKKLADGSYLGKLYESPKHRREDREGIVVRIVDYRIDGFRENYRLATNILDPAMAPALELARLYSTQRSPKGSRLTNSRSCTRSEWCTESYPGSFLFPPRERSYVFELMRAETLEERVRRRPGRHYPRGVKRKMSNWRVVTKAIRQADGYVDPKPPRVRLT